MRRVLLCVLLLLVGTATAGAGGASATAATVKPPAPRPLTAIEPLAAYVPQNSCDPHIKPGVSALAQLLKTTYPTSTYGSARNCSTARSEHEEGRALDWMVSVRVPAQKAEAETVLAWLFATDAAGNKLANLRRLGVMYLVWNNRIWGAWDQTWQPYQNCASTPDPSLDDNCHRSHIHFSLSWEGAEKQTSFWTNKVAAGNYGPCAPADLNWAPRYPWTSTSTPRTTPCAAHTRLVASTGASAFAKKLVAYSGARANLGESGPVVSVVQQAVGVPVDGYYGAGTRAAVVAWQKAHGLLAGGNVYQETWRSFLKAYKH